MAKSFSERVGTQLGILASYVVFTGLVTTEAYYSVFGIRYQTLQFPPAHILYRGITIIAGDLFMALPLFLAICWIVAGDAEPNGTRWRAAVRTLLMAVVALLIIGLTYQLSIHAGVAAGQRDALGMTSSLPRVETITGSAVRAGDAILWLDEREMIAFTPVTNASAVPVMKRILRSEIHDFSFTRP